MMHLSVFCNFHLFCTNNQCLEFDSFACDDKSNQLQESGHTQNVKPMHPTGQVENHLGRKVNILSTMGTADG
jgi:hypothetical protein